MAVKDDIFILNGKQNQLFKDQKRYVQCLPTPETIPAKDSISAISKMLNPSNETVEVSFTPTAKDYQFRIDVWTRLHEGIETTGFVVTAKRDLGDGLIETITSAEDM